MKERRGFDKESEDNASTIRTELGLLSSGHWDGPLRRDYRAFWAHVREISDMFKTLKPLRREDREMLWQRFGSLCEDAKSKQGSEIENRKFKSDQHRRYVLDEVEHSRPVSLFGFLSPDVEEMKGLGRLLRVAGQSLSRYKHEMFGEHKQECFEAIQEMQRVHDAWWEELRIYRDDRHQNFHARIRANLEKLHGMHSKATEALGRARAHADDLRDQIDSARTDKFRDLASGWLSEEESRNSDIEAHTARIEGWIDEEEDKLN